MNFCAVGDEGDAAVGARVECRDLELFVAFDDLGRGMSVAIVASAGKDYEIWIYETQK